MSELLLKHREQNRHLRELVKRRQRTKDHYKLLVDNQTDLIVKVNPEGRFLYVSKTYCEMFGKKEDELLDSFFMPLVYEEDRNITSRAMENLYKPPYACYVEQRALTKYGWKWLGWVDKAILDQNNNVIAIVGVGRDITKQKLAEEELKKHQDHLEELVKERTHELHEVNERLEIEIDERKLIEERLKESKNRYEALVKSLPVGIFQSRPKGYCVFLNKETSNILGRPPGEIAGYRWVQSICPEDREQVIKKFDESNKNQKPFKHEYRFLRPNGDVIWVSEMGTPYLGHDNKWWYVGSITDITELKKAEKALLLSEERFSKAFHANPNPMGIYVLADGRFIDVNNAFTSVTAYSHKELMSYKINELGLWGSQEHHEKVINSLRSKGQLHNLEVSFITKTGDRRTGLFSAEVIELSGEKNVLFTLNDITEYKEFEKQLVRFDRLALIGQMAAGIGHEVRNPMTTVRGFLQMLGARQKFDDYQEYFKLMISELDRANSIITEFLSLTKSKAESMEKICLNNVVESLFPLLQAEARNQNKDISFESGNIPSILLDKKEIRQLLLNLVKNGLEAMTPTGCLTLKTFMDGTHLILSIKDTGRGIPHHIIEKIGTPFLTTKAEGTGLGLAICYSIADRHNATIHFSTGIEGTTFFIRFPVNE